ncbi:MAG: transporter substrate-binding domain-containing protein [Clostridia bacterium]|nr:transporter substrate-binding domain-containing protein [Clostridia bacterium]
MKSIRKTKRWLSLLLAVLLAVLCFPAHAGRLVRIGYPDMSGLFYTDVDGRQSGYIYDLMMECAQITDRDYSFVRVNTDECYDLLKSGQIDLCVGVPGSNPNRELLSFGSESVITTPISMVVLPGSPVGYQDYAALDGGKVGIYAVSMSMQQIKAMLVVRGATVQLIDNYTSRQQLLDALKVGSIDAAIINSDLGITGLRVVASFGQRDYYCAGLANGDQSLLEETNNALQALKLANPGLMDTLHTRYQLVDDYVYPSLTRDELNYVRKGREIRVAIPRFQMLNSTTPTDPLRLVLNELSLKTGLKFTYVVRESEAEALAYLRSGKADIMLSFDSDYEWARDQGVRMSASYLDSTYRIITLPTAVSVRRLAVTENSYLHFRLSRENRYELSLYPNDDACIEAVQQGKVDGAVCWTPYAEQILYQMEDRNLVYDDVETMGGSVSIAVSKMSSFRLLPLLNKAIGSIRPQRLQTIALPAVGDLLTAQQESEARRLNYVLLLLLLMVLALLTVLAIWVANHLRNAALQVKARNDFLRAVSNQIRRPAQTIQGVVAGGTRLSRADTQQALNATGKQLGELSSEIEIMNQLDDHTFTLSPVPVHPEDVFQRLTEYVRQQATLQDVEVEVRMPKMECPVVMLDEEAYRRICLTIANNVLSRVGSGSQIQLQFDLERVREQKNQWILVSSFGDNGSMLSRQFVRRIAERTRWDSEQVLGLRLMTAKRIVQAMNGEMGVRQRPNAGMRMTVRLPVEQAEPLQMMSLNQGVYDGKGLLAGRNILLAEGNPITAQLLYSLLVNEGAHVDLAESTEAIQESFIASPPAFYQAILADLTLPGNMSTIQSILNIRDLPRRDCSSVFIIGMQSGTQAVESSAIHAMNIILQKPLNTNNLCRRLHTWLSVGH